MKLFSPTKEIASLGRTKKEKNDIVVEVAFLFQLLPMIQKNLLKKFPKKNMLRKKKKNSSVNNVDIYKSTTFFYQLNNKNQNLSCQNEKRRDLPTWKTPDANARVQK